MSIDKSKHRKDNEEIVGGKLKLIKGETCSIGKMKHRDSKSDHARGKRLFVSLRIKRFLKRIASGAL